MMSRVIEKTDSICPRCQEQIKAEIVERHGSVYMDKTCDEHGYFEGRISKYAWYYKGLNDFYNKISSNRYCFGSRQISDYQLFPRINSKLSYDIFFSNFDNPTIDISIEKIRKMIGLIGGPKGRIVMLGGEPTTRTDLPEIIKAISKKGYHPWIYSNGFMLDNSDYLKKLKDSGLVFLWLWVDSLRDDSIYEKIRGRRFLLEKRQVIDNFKRLDMPTGIILTVVRGINEQEIKDLVDFAMENSFVKAIVIKTYSHVGRKKFSLQTEFTIDELIELVFNETNLVTIEEFYVFQKMLYALFCFTDKPLCYLKQFIYLPRQKDRKLRDIIDLRRFEIYLDRFAEIYQESPLMAKMYFLKEIFKKNLENPLFLFLLGWQKFSWCRNYFLRLDISSYYTELNYDLNKIKRRCNDVWLPSLLEDKPVDFCRILINSFTSAVV